MKTVHGSIQNALSLVIDRIQPNAPARPKEIRVLAKKLSGQGISNSDKSRRMTIILLLIGFILGGIYSTEAQQATKVHRIGYLMPGSPNSESADSEGIRLALRELGYIEGQNIAFEYRYAVGKRDRFPELAAELVRLKVDIVIVDGGNNPARALKNATKTIPIVMTGGSDPIEAGLVESLARPGGNVTGLTNFARELGGKRLELLKEAVPKLARVAVLYQRGNTSQVREVKEILPVTARALKLTVQPWEVPEGDDFEPAFARSNKERPDGLYALSGTQMSANYGRIAGFALKSRLPSIYNNREAVDAGGLIFYGSDLVDSYRRVAHYVDRILKGAKPADLPVEQPTKLELVINLKTAKQIGVIIPQNMLARADSVIK
jgi:putative ABC transport system substrate-binding protein